MIPIPPTIIIKNSQILIFLKNHSRGWIQIKTFEDMDNIKELLEQMQWEDSSIGSTKDSIPYFVIKTYNECTNSNDIHFYSSISSLCEDINKYK